MENFPTKDEYLDIYKHENSNKFLNIFKHALFQIVFFRNIYTKECFCTKGDINTGILTLALFIGGLLLSVKLWGIIFLQSDSEIKWFQQQHSAYSVVKRIFYDKPTLSRIFLSP